MISQKERRRRWQLAIGVDDEKNELSDRDRRLNAALSALYDSGRRSAEVDSARPLRELQDGSGTFASSSPLLWCKLSRKMHSSG